MKIKITHTHTHTLPCSKQKIKICKRVKSYEMIFFSNCLNCTKKIC
jgi:hypothetical protein